MLRRTQEKQLKETQRTRGQEPTLPLCSPDSGFDEALATLLVPLFHTSDCMTISWPVAATQTSKSKPFFLQPFLSPGLRLAHNMLA